MVSQLTRQPAATRAAAWQEAEVRRMRYLALLPLAFLLVFFIYPISDLLVTSFRDGDYVGATYVALASDEVFRLALRNSFLFAFVTACCACILGYPVALMIGFSRPPIGTVLMFFVLVPFWTSVLVRSYAWLVILGRQGLVNALWHGVSDGEPLQLIFNGIGVSVALVHVMLPYVILPVVSVISRLDKSVIGAASSLGASRWQAFRRVLLPLTAPGLAGGFALVFILTIGFFITPTLMGGPRNVVTAMMIHDKVTRQLAWGEAAAISVILLALMGCVFYLSSRVLGLREHMSVKVST